MPAGLLVRQLDGVKRVLMIGAHPDDEDTSLLAALARGWGARVAYLSLNRGEGGQNLVGPELDEGLGLIRTGELEAARELDGAEQYFTRAFDFGYSRSAEETFRHWSREEVLADVVWVVRSFRPQVILSVFSGTPRDRHGHHQVAGILAREAFDAAGDPDRFPEQTGPGGVEPWSPDKLYRVARFTPDEATSGLETGAFDPLLGKSHFQLAMESRSQHRSQDMGAPRPPGPRESPVELLRTRVEAGPGDPGLFAGVDTALLSRADGLSGDRRGEVASDLRAYREAVAGARERLHAYRPGEAVEDLREALDRIRSARARAPEGSELARDLDDRIPRVERALLAAAGVVLDVRADRSEVVPGEPFTVEALLWNGGGLSVEDAEPSLFVPEGWEVSAEVEEEAVAGSGGGFFGLDREGAPLVRGPAPVPSGQLRRWAFRVIPPPDAALSRPYFLRQPLEGSMYRWPEDRSLWGLSRDPPVVGARVSLGLAGSGGAPGESTPLELRKGAQHVFVDKALGELREPVVVVPPVSLTMEPSVLAWPAGDAAPRTVSVELRSQARGETAGAVRLEVPEGWDAEPRERSFRLEGEGASTSLAFRLLPAPEAGEGRVRIEALARTGDGREYREGFRTVDYPHMEKFLHFEPARALISRFPVRVAEGIRVGYVMGSGDRGPEALRQMGARVTLLDEEAVRAGAYQDFDVVVLGVRAYETRPDLNDANSRLLDFAREGGTVVAQYNKYEYSGTGLAPYPVRIDRPHDRVTDPDAPVRILDPDAPVFRWPNRITEEDFRGWVQERGLYFLAEWDERYTPLLEMSDPGLEPNRGSLLVAPVGEGLYIYTGLAFFRQFPEGVPGAYRLFANLVSLDAGEWRARAADGGEPGGAR